MIVVAGESVEKVAMDEKAAPFFPCHGGRRFCHSRINIDF